MRLLALLVALSACAAEIPPPPAGTCTRNAKLPQPPAPSMRSIPKLVAWANTAAGVANRAIDERDLCYGSYQRLEEWARSIKR